MSWAHGRLPGYRPTLADLTAFALGLHESHESPIAVPIVVRN